MVGSEAVESFASFRGGKGGYWEDLGYAWYAGIELLSCSINN